MQNKFVNPVDPSKQPSRPAFRRSEDIPEALRADTTPTIDTPQIRGFHPRHGLLWGTVLCSASALGLLVWQQTHLSIVLPSVSDRSPATPAVTGLQNSTESLRQSQPLPPATPTPNQPAPPLLGHFPYAEAPASSLQAIVSDGSIKLRQPAAAQFLAMVKAANAQGVPIRPISGFRSVAEQERVFFDIKAERGQPVRQRASVSAPPGHSEHHTGYAIDIGDGTRPATDLQVSFETTAAFRWLQQNAARFGFEMSFPRSSPQTVSYEPWHWRFVGDRHSLETFYRARTAHPKP